MDKSGEKLHVTGADRPTRRGRRDVESASPPASRHAEPIHLRLRSIEVQSHFEPREWQLASGATATFDHALLLQSGEAGLKTREDRLHVLAPAFAWIPATSGHRLDIEAGGSGHLLAIRHDVIEQTLRLFPEASEMLGLLDAEQPIALGIEPHTATQIARTMALISSELAELAPGAETVISSALVISLVHLWRHFGARGLARGGLGGSAALLMRFRQLVEERFREHWTVAHYSNALGLTPDRLHAICTRTLGRAPRTLIQQRIMSEAVARLERSAITIKQLSFLLGFKDAAYFNRFFARQMGVPPARYRRERLQREAAGRPPAMTFTLADWP